MLKSALRIAGLVVILLSSLAPMRALAQASSQAPSQGPMAAPAPDAGAMAAALELISAMKVDEQFKALMPTILKTMKPAIVQNRPAVERDFDALTPLLMSGFEKRLGELMKAVVIIYASNFTAEELRAVLAFYRTPAGQTFLQKTPLVTQQAMLAGQRFGQSVAADTQQRAIEELRKKGHTL